ncbi:neuromedin-U isoform X2 [Acinonyx jubatus]|uniref:Neuromedin-U isoform X2 n=1 Tax=Acinonyx jubatus TaxID=32536 RepID=A0ABM3PNS5_ACIJB|nr:neuromedin-U isoform X2 [Acinonyx jubatus]
MRTVLSQNSGRGRVPLRLGASGAGSGWPVTRRRPGAAGCEVTRVGTALAQPTCPRDLKVGGARGGQLGGGAPRAALPGRRGTARAPRGVLTRAAQASSSEPPSAEMPRAANRRPGPPAGQVAAASRPLLLLLLACCAGTCLGAPILSQGLRPEQELQLWNEIDDACSSFLSLDSQPQASNALEELCITIRRTLPKPQETDEKDNTKRFLFHYSKTRKLGNSNVVLVPHLHERRTKRFRLDFTKGETTQNKDLSQDNARRIPRSYCKPSSETVFIQATQWKKVRRLHLKWTNNFPQKQQNVDILFSSQKQSLLNLLYLTIPVL